MTQNLLDVNLGGGSVLQYANRDPYQMMGYLLKTPEGKTVIIDGGRQEGADAAYLHELIRQEGGRVDLWLITHATMTISAPCPVFCGIWISWILKFAICACASRRSNG